VTLLIAVVVGRAYTRSLFGGSERIRRGDCHLTVALSLRSRRSILLWHRASKGGFLSSGPSRRFPTSIVGQQLAVPPKRRKDTPKWPVLMPPMHALYPRPESIRKTSLSPRRHRASRVCRGGASQTSTSRFLLALSSKSASTFMEVGL
jgi:hypothetical protein